MEFLHPEVTGQREALQRSAVLLHLCYLWTIVFLLCVISVCAHDRWRTSYYYISTSLLPLRCRCWSVSRTDPFIHSSSHAFVRPRRRRRKRHSSFFGAAKGRDGRQRRTWLLCVSHRQPENQVSGECTHTVHRNVGLSRRGSLGRDGESGGGLGSQN